LLVEKVQKLKGTVGVSFLDVTTGEVLAAFQEHRPLNPASNAKILTAATTLALLRPNYRFQTVIYGNQKGSNAPQLIVRGTGDPSLTSKDLWGMAQEVKEAGLRRIDGDIIVDQQFFDDQVVPPAFEQQPNEWASFRAPVSAVALNENTVTLTVRPAAKGASALAAFDPPGYVDVEGAVKTVEEGAAQNIGLSLQPIGLRLAAKLSGNVPETARVLHFTKRVDNPTLLAGYALKALLVQSGVAVSGEVKTGGENLKAKPLADHFSKPLSLMLYELGKQSDNFYAEMVFKGLALEKKGRPAKSTIAAELVTQYLTEVGAWEDGMIVKNGSGLFDSNRVTASALAKLLRVAHRDPAYANEFVAQLAIGGTDGTLRSRFRSLKNKGVVRAKTGTLEGAAALSGYIFGAPNRGPVAFSILINDIAGKVGEGRSAIDDCVESIAKLRSASP